MCVCVCVCVCVCAIYIACTRYYNPQFQQSSFLCKYQLEYISTGRLQLFDFLLGNNVLLSYFMEVCHLPALVVVLLIPCGETCCLDRLDAL